MPYTSNAEDLFAAGQPFEETLGKILAQNADYGVQGGSLEHKELTHSGLSDSVWFLPVGFTFERVILVQWDATSRILFPSWISWIAGGNSITITAAGLDTIANGGMGIPDDPTAGTPLANFGRMSVIFFKREA